MAGNTAVLVTYPLEIVRTRLAFQIRHQIPVETHRKHHTFHPPVPHKHIEHSGYTIAKDNYGIIHTCRTVYQEGGILAFYKGFLTTMLGIVPYAGAAFMSYEYMKQKCFSEYKESTTVWNEKRQKHELKIGTHLLIGGAAGMFGQTAAYPFDTVRHRLQLVGISKSIPTYKSMADAFKTIFRVEGWRGFFVGLSINYWKTMPANAVAFVSYEKMKQLLEI
jgi:solute carrier family 25 protein 16